MREGEELPPRTRTVTAEDIAAYAEAGGDRNPIHLDREAAVAAGLRGIIAHGMFTLGHLAATVAGWAGTSDAILSIGGQFRAMVRPGDEITAGGTVRSVEDGVATLDLWVKVEGPEQQLAVRRGQARIRLS